MDRLLDLRFAIGLFFLLAGGLLFGYSFFDSSVEEATSSVNRWCGGIFIVFGSLMSGSLWVSTQVFQRKDSKDETD